MPENFGDELVKLLRAKLVQAVITQFFANIVSLKESDFEAYVEYLHQSKPESAEWTPALMTLVKFINRKVADGKEDVFTDLFKEKGWEIGDKE